MSPHLTSDPQPCSPCRRGPCSLKDKGIQGARLTQGFRLDWAQAVPGTTDQGGAPASSPYRSCTG